MKYNLYIKSIFRNFNEENARIMIQRRFFPKPMIPPILDIMERAVIWRPETVFSTDSSKSM